MNERTRKTQKIFFILLFATLFIVLLSTNSNAAVEVTRDIYSNNGSMKFNFSGLELDKSHEYEFGLAKTAAEQISNWHLITEYTENTATLDIVSSTSAFRRVIDAVDTGYITIKDKTTDEKVLEPYAVDLKMPFLKVTNYTVVPNGKSFKGEEKVQVPLRNTINSDAYYQYEKITDQNVINKYKEIKANNGDIYELQSLLKTDVPKSNWKEWKSWGGFSVQAVGDGYPESEVSVPEAGLYYLWVYFSGIDVKNMYGYILVDNLQPEVALESISLPETATVKLGETLQLNPVFNPSGATNKKVTWSSSDENVATIDNAGKVTPKKEGQTIIKIVSEDGNKTATCTVTVTKNTSDNNGNNNNQNNNNQNGTNTDNKNDNTTAPGKLPQTGFGVSKILLSILAISMVSGIIYFKVRKMKDIK